MTNEGHLQNIALVGASGTIGSQILNHLLGTNKFHVTVISRSDSKATFPSHSSLTVHKGSYSDPEFLQTAFSDQDAAVIALNFMAMGLQPGIIEAAAKAGVKWIVPTEYAMDGLNETLAKNLSKVPIMLPKVMARKQVEELARDYPGLSWIGVATNPWTEFNLAQGGLGFNIPSRTATLYSGAGLFNSVTLPQAGLGIARLLSLPLTNSSKPRASLAHYANNFVYLSSFLISQDVLFDSLKRVTGTTDGDWKITQSSIEEWEKACFEGLAKGDMRSAGGLIFVNYMGEGRGGNYEAKAKVDREVLGLEEEDLDAAVKRAVDAGEVEKVFK